MNTIRVDRDRLWRTLMQLKEIGAYDDDATGLRGVKRLALTDEDAQARRLVVSWMEEAGLSLRVDRIGNVYATRAGTDPSLPGVLMGSHIDTVATGGAFDGTLGVLGGIEVMRAFDERHPEPGRADGRSAQPRRRRDERRGGAPGRVRRRVGEGTRGERVVRADGEDRRRPLRRRGAGAARADRGQPGRAVRLRDVGSRGTTRRRSRRSAPPPWCSWPGSTAGSATPRASTPTRRRAPTASTCWPTQCSAGEPGAHRCFPAHREPLRRAGKSEYCSGVAAGEAVNV